MCREEIRYNTACDNHVAAEKDKLGLWDSDFFVCLFRYLSLLFSLLLLFFYIYIVYKMFVFVILE